VVILRHAELGNHILARLLELSFWPIPKNAHSIVRATAPGYRPRVIKIPWLVGDKRPEPVTVDLKRTIEPGGFVELELKTPWGDPLGPYSGWGVLKDADRGTIPLHISIDKKGRGSLGYLPAGRYELIFHDFERNTYAVSVGTTVRWTLIPQIGLVSVRPLFESETGTIGEILAGGVALRVVPGHLGPMIKVGHFERFKGGMKIMTRTTTRSV
jgi:hypothetical protein